MEQMQEQQNVNSRKRRPPLPSKHDGTHADNKKREAALQKIIENLEMQLLEYKKKYDFERSTSYVTKKTLSD